MTDRSQHNFRTTELDKVLLKTPFKVQTKWHVITGAPSCGKTTMINLLADKGFQFVPESARQYMEEEVASGKNIEEIHTNATTLQIAIKDMQLEIERCLSVDVVLFLDGAVPGSLAWYRVFGLDPNEILPECFHHRYALVFILDQLPLHQNGYRFENDSYADFLGKWHTRDYRALGYDVVRVPVLPPEERLAFVLERLSTEGML
jgi:predicted ATPase